MDESRDDRPASVSFLVFDQGPPLAVARIRPLRAKAGGTIEAERIADAALGHFGRDRNLRLVAILSAVQAGPCLDEFDDALIQERGRIFPERREVKWIPVRMSSTKDVLTFMTSAKSARSSRFRNSTSGKRLDLAASSSRICCAGRAGLGLRAVGVASCVGAWMRLEVAWVAEWPVSEKGGRSRKLMRKVATED